MNHALTIHTVVLQLQQAAEHLDRLAGMTPLIETIGGGELNSLAGAFGGIMDNLSGILHDQVEILEAVKADIEAPEGGAA